MPLLPVPSVASAPSHWLAGHHYLHGRSAPFGTSFLIGLPGLPRAAVGCEGRQSHRCCCASALALHCNGGSRWEGYEEQCAVAPSPSLSDSRGRPCSGGGPNRPDVSPAAAVRLSRGWGGSGGAAPAAAWLAGSDELCSGVPGGGGGRLETGEIWNVANCAKVCRGILSPEASRNQPKGSEAKNNSCTEDRPPIWGLFRKFHFSQRTIFLMRAQSDHVHFR